MDRLGEIIVVKSIVFNNGLADHASLSGRLCLALSDYGDTLSLLPFTHKRTISNKLLFECDINNDFENNRIKRKFNKSYIQLSGLFQRNIYFYDSVAILKIEKYYALLNKLLSLDLQNNIYCRDAFLGIKDDLIDQRDDLSLRFKKRD